MQNHLLCNCEFSWYFLKKIQFEIWSDYIGILLRIFLRSIFQVKNGNYRHEYFVFEMYFFFNFITRTYAGQNTIYSRAKTRQGIHNFRAKRYSCCPRSHDDNTSKNCQISSNPSRNSKMSLWMKLNITRLRLHPSIVSFYGKGEIKIKT